MRRWTSRRLPLRIGPRDFRVGFESREQFVPRLYSHAVGLGLDSRSAGVSARGDPGRWSPVDRGAECRVLPCAGQNHHRNSQVLSCDGNLCGGGPSRLAGGSVSGQNVGRSACHGLQRAGWEGLEAAWALPPALSPTAAGRVAPEQGYVAYYRPRLDCPNHEAQGLPIGSGMVESACKAVVKQRESGSGMRWLEQPPQGAQAIATLRAGHGSGKWDASGARQSCARLVPEKRRIAAESQI